jgi:hypothetical protein
VEIAAKILPRKSANVIRLQKDGDRATMLVLGDALLFRTAVDVSMDVAIQDATIKDFAGVPASAQVFVSNQNLCFGGVSRPLTPRRFDEQTFQGMFIGEQWRDLEHAPAILMPGLVSAVRECFAAAASGPTREILSVVVVTQDKENQGRLCAMATDGHRLHVAHNLTAQPYTDLEFCIPISVAHAIALLDEQHEATVKVVKADQHWQRNRVEITFSEALFRFEQSPAPAISGWWHVIKNAKNYTDGALLSLDKMRGALKALKPSLIKKEQQGKPGVRLLVFSSSENGLKITANEEGGAEVVVPIISQCGRGAENEAMRFQFDYLQQALAAMPRQGNVAVTFGSQEQPVCLVSADQNTVALAMPFLGGI